MTEYVAGELVEAWIALCRLDPKSEARDAHFWAFEALDDMVRDDPERALAVVVAIQDRDGSMAVLANVAAGPLEDLLVYHGERMVDRIVALGRSNQRFRTMLQMVWKNAMSDAVWDRIQVFNGPPTLTPQSKPRRRSR